MKAHLSTLCAWMRARFDQRRDRRSVLGDEHRATQSGKAFRHRAAQSKSPAYFLSNSHGFNTVHGRMPSVATGSESRQPRSDLFRCFGGRRYGVDRMGQFVHVVRRNLNMVYLVMNNGCYGLTKGQDSATGGRGLQEQGRKREPF
jgi:pyruvate/2-oxoacid:ferredoxin oxidoreductase beta subunit